MGLKYDFIPNDRLLVYRLILIVPITLMIIYGFIAYFWQTEQEKRTWSKSPENPILSTVTSIFGEKIKTEKLNKKMP